MSGYLKQQLVEKLAEVGNVVLSCIQVQTREWRELAKMVTAVHRKTYADAVIQKTYWVPALSDFFRKKRDFLVDLETGKLMSVESFLDFLHKGAPLDEVKSVPDEFAAMLGFCIDSFDAEVVARHCRESPLGYPTRGNWSFGKRVCSYEATHPFFGTVLLILKD